MQNAERFAAFQASLLDILHEGGTAMEMRARLQPVAEACGLGDYVHSFEGRMLVVASELVQKWGAKCSSDDSPQGQI